MVRWGIRILPRADSLFVRADDFLGYGKRVSAGTFWTGVSANEGKEEAR
jgi:hypothetical protein